MQLMRTITRGCLVLSIVFFCIPKVIINGQGETQSVETEGLAVIVQGNTAIARDTAIIDAQRKAVEQAVGVFMSSESVVENYELISDRILAQSAGYIQQYQILEEQQTDTEYRVRINAVVGMGNLEHDVAAIQHLIRQKGNPRIMFLVQEEIVGLKTAGVASADMAQAEAGLLQAFLNAGFEMVDSAMVAQNINQAQAIQAIAGDHGTAAALGLEYGADVTITVKVSASAGEKILNTNMKSHQAAITAKVIRTDTAAVMVSAAEQATYAHIDDLAGGIGAIEKAAAQLAETLIPQILEQWRQDVQVATTVQIRLSNVSFIQLKRFREILHTEIRGVNDVYQRSFQANTAVLDVEIQNSAEGLADTLTSKQFDGMTFVITGMSENTIEIAVQ